MITGLLVLVQIIASASAPGPTPATPAPAVGAGAAAQPGTGAGDLAAADAALKTGDVASWETARLIYERALAARPGDLDLMLQVAWARNQILGARSRAGAFGIDGITSSAEERAACAEMAPLASELADRVAQARPHDIRALFARSLAYAYRAASFGIIEAIARGTAGVIRANAQAMVDTNPSFDRGAGFFTLGVFHTLAPWPIGNKDDADAYFRRALEVDPVSQRNQYGRAVFLWRRGQRDEARRTFARVLTLPCGEPAEAPLCAYYQAEARRVLAL